MPRGQPSQCLPHLVVGHWQDGDYRTPWMPAARGPLSAQKPTTKLKVRLLFVVTLLQQVQTMSATNYPPMKISHCSKLYPIVAVAIEF